MKYLHFVKLYTEGALNFRSIVDTTTTSTYTATTTTAAAAIFWFSFSLPEFSEITQGYSGYLKGLPKKKLWLLSVQDETCCQIEVSPSWLRCSRSLLLCRFSAASVRWWRFRKANDLLWDITTGGFFHFALLHAAADVSARRSYQTALSNTSSFIFVLTFCSCVLLLLRSAVTNYVWVFFGL